MKAFILPLICASLLLISCGSETESNTEVKTKKQGFTKIEAVQSGINFSNNIVEDLSFNFLSYPYIYNGAGVAAGDLNNDGLIDLYFTANQGPNKLYINKGDFKFEDKTFESKTTDSEGFSTGVTMLDINNDGWLDIYVCKAAALQDSNLRKNKLYLNNQDGTFTESAEKWGIADAGFSTQAYSLDYDKDGDLDLYVLNYRNDFKNNTKIYGAIQNQLIKETSDQLYRNDGTTFTNVTATSGVANKAWGLGVSIGDFNGDSWPDLYVSNDYLEPDMMYINQKNGTFKNEILDRINHISFNSMGSDYSDINNDGLPDLFTVDMLAEDHQRGKENMATMSTSNFWKMVDVGYHHQYMSNMVHMNTNNGTFTEVSQLTGISKTDWSWAPLIADLDNDGQKDVYITNGIYKDITNQDFRRNIKELNEKGVAMTLDQLHDILPTQKLINYAYQNKGDLSFENKTKAWGLDTGSHSNGGTYADLDNDGDLDLVINNLSETAHVYRNNSNNNYLDVVLKGPANNSLGIGAKVEFSAYDQTQSQEQYLTRGFQSSVAPRIHFGMGDRTNGKLKITWPDNKVSEVNNVNANQVLTVDYASAKIAPTSSNAVVTNTWAAVNAKSLGLDFTHVENDFDDFELQLLLPHKKSTIGTEIAVADLNGDGLEDIFVGNALGAKAATYLQQTNGTFKANNQALWNTEKGYEDVGALFFDADQDGDQDLYVVSGGYELAPNAHNFKTDYT